MKQVFFKKIKNSLHCLANLKFVAACLYNSQASSALSPLFPNILSKNPPEIQFKIRIMVLKKNL